MASLGEIFGRAMERDEAHESDTRKRALQAKSNYKKKMHGVRSQLRDKGYTTIKEKSYYDYNHRERKNIRDNDKPGSKMRQWIGESRSKNYKSKTFNQ